MMQLMRLQFVGTAFVISALLAAELAAIALSADPASTFLWKLNLEIFRGINATYWMADAFYPLDHRLTITALVALFAISVAAYHWKARLGLAVLSNLAFIYCGVLAYASFVPYGTPVETASLQPVLVPFDSGGLLVLDLLFGSLAGAVASHLVYLKCFRRIAGRHGSPA